METIWPENHPFAICLTHDVDHVRKTPIHYLSGLLHNPFTLDNWHFFKDNPYWNFEKIMELEDRYGVRSTFFFIEEQNLFKHKGPMDWFRPINWRLFAFRYSITEPDIRSIMKRLDSGGWEIGLHGSFDSYRRIDLLKKEKRTLEHILGKQVKGIRQHCLNISIPDTWTLQKEVGFEYDATFGSNTKIGFPDNQYYPFHPFDDDFLVLPLVIMDGPLFAGHQDIKSALNTCKYLMMEAYQNSGLITVLFHQRVFSENEFPGWSDIYEEIICEGIKMGAWFSTGCGIASHISKSFLQFVLKIRLFMM